MTTGEAMNKEQKMFFQELLLKITHVSNNASMIQNVIHDYNIIIHDVFDKIKSVEGISNKTNLLAINASIETIHASDLLASFEHIVTNNLRIQARVIAKILQYDPDFLFQDGAKFAKECGLEEFFITDEEGVVKFTNLPAWNNAILSSSEILKILKNPELEVALPSTGNGTESEQFKVIGIGRKDKPGVIQLGAHFLRPSGQLAIDGFGVVAKEAKRLADVSKEISSKITRLTNEMGDKVTELNQSSNEVSESILKVLEIVEQALEGEENKAIGEAVILMKSKISPLDDSIREIRKYFKSILSPLTELINIARQTNLLGVRAAIEAAHSTNDKQDFDNLLNRHMTVEAKLAAILVERRPDITCSDMVEFVEYSGIGEFWITDEYGTVELTNVPGGKGFVFQNEGQTAPYMRILANPDLVVTAPPAMRTLDNRVFKFAAVGRKGKPGIFQIGNPSKMYGESTAEGFSVVSKQIKTLAEQSRDVTIEIEEMIESMDSKAQKALESIRGINKQLLSIQF